MFDEDDEKWVYRLLGLDEDLGNHVRCGDVQGVYPFLIMEAASTSYGDSTYAAQNKQATSGACVNRMTNELFDRAKPLIEGAFPNILSTVPFSFTVTPSHADLWIHFSKIKEVMKEQRRVYYSHQLESYWLGKEGNIHYFYRTLLRILIWAYTIRLSDIRKALKVLANVHPQASDPTYFRDDFKSEEEDSDY